MKPVKKGKPKKRARKSKRKYVLDPEVASDFHQLMIDRQMDKATKEKLKAIAGEIDPMMTSNTSLATNTYIKSNVLECLPTRDVRLDLNWAVDINGDRGIPRGKTVEISGPSEHFKSARMYQLLADIQADPRGAICKHYETEGKFHPKYFKMAGGNPSSLLVSEPSFIEAIYLDMVALMLDYIKQRNKFIKPHVSKMIKKSMSNLEISRLIHEASLGFPILAFTYDSLGNHASLLKWKKAQKGTETKTPGAHAAAHAEGFRDIKMMLANTMSVFMYVNHTKDVLDIGGGGGGGGKKTDTYGGKAVKLMSDVRFEQRGGIGDTKSSSLMVQRGGKKIIIGRWLTIKWLKNSIIETSRTTTEHVLFSYKYGFNAGAAYMQALKEVGMIKGPVSLSQSKQTKVIMPNGDVVPVKMDEFHKILMADPDLQHEFRKHIMEHANKNTVHLRTDI